MSIYLFSIDSRRVHVVRSTTREVEMKKPSYDISPEEAALPIWAQRELSGLRLALAEANARIAYAQARLDKLDTKERKD